MAKKRLLSGVKPTGKPHIGNYFGAMKQFVDLQNDYDCLYMIADYHGLNFIHNGEEMRELSQSLVLDHLGIGLDPKTVTLFKQSAISEHTELAWIFDTITTVPYLMRSHAYKDKAAKNEELSVGSFNYPMLMAADILLYDAEIVPVGADQKQHIEYARDTAQKFNGIYGDTFRLPEEKIIEGVGVVPGIDGKKMSKSYHNDIALFASKDDIAKFVMSIVTDSSGGRPENVYAIHKLFKNEAELEPLYASNAGNYKKLKETLVEDIDTMVAPMRERRKQFEDTPDEVAKVIEAGNMVAKEIASKKMTEVRKKIGVAP